MPRDWYLRQADLWRNEVNQNPKNGAAWQNYYMAIEYSYLGTTAIAGAALPELQKYLIAEKPDEKLAQAFFTEAGPSPLAQSMTGL